MDVQEQAGNIHACDDNANGDNEPPICIARVVIEPYDSQLINNPVFQNTKFTEVSLAVLESEKA
eukprot:10162362-Ditylum_brightwellii.AAC.1